MADAGRKSAVDLPPVSPIAFRPCSNGEFCPRPETQVDRRAEELFARMVDVYAELGSTWRNLMTTPIEAAHVLGKLLKHLGEDRIVWGTDSVFTGSAQEQIVALRAFQIPESMQEQFGYPALTDQAKRKILGLNGARVYGIDVAATRCVLDDDALGRLKVAYRDDPDSLPVPKEKSYGPRTRREFLAFSRWERG